MGDGGRADREARRRGLARGAAGWRDKEGGGGGRRKSREAEKVDEVRQARREVRVDGTLRRPQGGLGSQGPAEGL